MTKYICECLDGAGKCTHETPNFSAPTLYCVRAHSTCHWRAAEEQKPELPKWCKVGAWVWHGPFDGINFEQPYFKIERIDGELVYEKSHNNGFPVHYAYLKQARLRPWTHKEAIGKIVFWKGDYDYQENAAMLVGADTDGDFSLYTVGPVTAEELTKEIYYQSDGSPCGVLEHYENGEWVE